MASFLSCPKSGMYNFGGFIGKFWMETDHISSPEVIKELQGGLKALSGKTVVVLVSLNLS